VAMAEPVKPRLCPSLPSRRGALVLTSCRHGAPNRAEQNGSRRRRIEESGSIGDLANFTKNRSFIRPCGCEKLATPCQRSALLPSAALPCKVRDQRGSS
jgi:hypothetical protein